MKQIICYFLVCFHLNTGYIEEACIIPCPSDCKLSEWSNWSRCSKSCGSGVKVRSKWLREKPYNGGRPCPKLDHVNQVSWELWSLWCLFSTGGPWSISMIYCFLLKQLIFHQEQTEYLSLMLSNNSFHFSLNFFLLWSRELHYRLRWAIYIYSRFLG